MRKESDKWFNRIVRDSRYNDRRQDRYISPNIEYVDTETLLFLQQDQQNKCYYCQCQMNWLERRRSKNGLTVERKNNDLPHYKSNCVGLCCKSCNSKRYKRDHGLLLRYFSKWKKAALDVHVTVRGDRSACFAS